MSVMPVLFLGSDDALWVMERARFQCQCCGIGNGEWDRRTRKQVRLTVIPKDGDYSNFALSNSQCVCGFCALAQAAGAAQALLL